jgi:hypothetical protein
VCIVGEGNSLAVIFDKGNKFLRNVFLSADISFRLVASRLKVQDTTVASASAWIYST